MSEQSVLKIGTVGMLVLTAAIFIHGRMRRGTDAVHADTRSTDASSVRLASSDSSSAASIRPTAELDMAFDKTAEAERSGRLKFGQAMGMNSGDEAVSNLAGAAVADSVSEPDETNAIETPSESSNASPSGRLAAEAWATADQHLRPKRPVGSSAKSSRPPQTLDTRQAGFTASESPLVRVGRIEAVPERSDLRTLSMIPRTPGEVLRLYSAARDQSCRLLGEGVAVHEPLQITPGSAGVFGRIDAVTIGLELAQSGRDRLPAVTRSQVLKYFQEHRLAVQPVVYHDANGRCYFGNECKAAFFHQLSQPGPGSSVTGNPEPMIQSAVSRFRSLGIVPDARSAGRRYSLTDAPEMGRTLALAFAYQQETGSLTQGRTTVVELMLLHLPPGFGPRNPRLSVFITQGGGATLHQLSAPLRSPVAASALSRAPSITATVRFDKTTLLGMYPADPVVTDVQFRSDRSVPLATLLARLDDESGGSDDEGGPTTLSSLLDQFESIAQQSESDPNGSGDASMHWLDRIRMEKQRQLQQTLQSAGRPANGDSALGRPLPPLR
ncbi:hypothetical protein [Crateriforma conspicua]|nr:hypothetical protein [Crateriforma conspicua]